MTAILRIRLVAHTKCTLCVIALKCINSSIANVVVVAVVLFDKVITVVVFLAVVVIFDIVIINAHGLCCLCSLYQG